MSKLFEIDKKYTEKYKEALVPCHICGNTDIRIISKRHPSHLTNIYQACCSTLHCESTKNFVSVKKAVQNWNEINQIPQENSWRSILNDNIYSLFKYFAKFNKELYIVGGAVRSFLLGEKPHDFDFCTNATPAQMKEIAEFMNTKGLFVEIIPTGEEFGTLTFVFNTKQEKEFYEITTYRSEGRYTDFRHPDTLCFCNSIKEDLSRRDFTCNAIAWNPTEQFVDLFFGIDDITKNKIIRTVGDPEQRFSEDALRIIRLVRFSLTYNLQIASETLLAAFRKIGRLNHISKERIGAELNKIFKIDLAEKINNKSALELLEKILTLVNKGAAIDFSRVVYSTTPLAKWYWAIDSENKTTQEIISFLTPFALGSFYTKGVRNLKLAVCEAKQYPEIKKLAFKALRYLDYLEIDAFLDIIKDYQWQYKFKEYWISRQPLHLWQLAINGDFLRNHFNLQAGKLVGELLNKCLDFVVQFPEKNTEASLTELVKQELLAKGEEI